MENDQNECAGKRADLHTRLASLEASEAWAKEQISDQIRRVGFLGAWNRPTAEACAKIAAYRTFLDILPTCRASIRAELDKLEPDDHQGDQNGRRK